MTTYLVGAITKSLQNPSWIPVGIVARDGEQVEVRVVSLEQIPERYRFESDLGRAMLADLEPIFRQQEKPCRNPSDLYFRSIEVPEESGTLAERADVLFRERVLSHYQ